MANAPYPPGHFGPGVVSVYPRAERVAYAVFHPPSHALRAWEVVVPSVLDPGGDEWHNMRVTCGAIRGRQHLMAECSTVVIECRPARSTRTTTLMEGALAGFFHAQPWARVRHVPPTFKWGALPDGTPPYRAPNGGNPPDRVAIVVQAATLWLEANPQPAQVTSAFHANACPQTRGDMAACLVQALAACNQQIVAE